MHSDILDVYDLGNSLNIGNINYDDNINRKSKEHFNTVMRYIGEKKFITCERSLKEILNDFKKDPFEYVLFMTLKIYCNLRLHNYRPVSNDLSSLGNLDGENYKFEHFSEKYKKKRGSMIPFMLRLINCYYPYTLGLHFTSFDRLYLLVLHYEGMLQRSESEEGQSSDSHVVSSTVRIRRVVFHYITITCYMLCDLLLKKNYVEQAILLLREKILKHDPQHMNTISLIGKLSLLIGSFDIAEASFSLVGAPGEKEKEATTQVDMDINHEGMIHPSNCVKSEHARMNNSFMHLYLENYERALNELLLANPYIEKDEGKILINDKAIFHNNLAVSYFYNSNLEKAMEILENSITTNYCNLIPSIIKNLNYFYEFSKTDNETVNKINDFVENNLKEDQEIMALLPRRGLLQDGTQFCMGKKDKAHGKPKRQSKHAERDRKCHLKAPKSITYGKSYTPPYPNPLFSIP
ncbi:conserved Plasmodium protein, unknown function, partial [Plasmodium ovale curtisi]